MYHYRQALVRMRQGESDRQIHATELMGRRTLRDAAHAGTAAGLATHTIFVVIWRQVYSRNTRDL